MIHSDGCSVHSHPNGSCTVTHHIGNRVWRANMGFTIAPISCKHTLIQLRAITDGFQVTGMIIGLLDSSCF